MPRKKAYDAVVSEAAEMFVALYAEQLPPKERKGAAKLAELAK